MVNNKSCCFTFFCCLLLTNCAEQKPLIVQSSLLSKRDRLPFEYEYKRNNMDQLKKVAKDPFYNKAREVWRNWRPENSTTEEGWGRTGSTMKQDTKTSKDNK
ncbi:hypothetical protein niasHT_009919 [Heterodera trifolii]|uniref:Gland protein n=1 Tax=Heterodera trifolii TaxID=157864 RepID=A0ABD2MFF8_9BILA